MRHDLCLGGHGVVLRPLLTSDASALARVSTDSPSPTEDLRWHTSVLPLDEPSARAGIEAVVDNPTVRGFAVEGEDGQLRGITSFYEHAPAVPRVEVGHTQYGRAFWGGPTNPSCKLLMLTHAFDVWGCARVALRCDADNLRSAGAIRRLGATPEGVLRAHRRRHDGTVADTAYFSVVAAEWASVRAGLLARLEAGPATQV